MTKGICYLSLTLFLILTGSCCAAVYGQTPPTCGCVFSGSQPPQNVVVRFAGEAEPRRAAVNMVVHKGDLLRVTRPVKATLICDNMTEPVALSSTPRNQPVPCSSIPESGILIGRNGRSLDSTTMGATARSDFPVIISPRSTKILNPRPILRWLSIPSTTTYRVTVRWADGSWSTTVQTKRGEKINALTYPAPCQLGENVECAPALTSLRSYKLIVEANNRSSEEEGLAGLGFSLISPETRIVVEHESTKINQLTLDDSVKTKMLASLYVNYDLNDEALRLLEQSVAVQEDPESIRLLGNIYLKIGFPVEAEYWYLKPREPALAANDSPVGQAVTNETLGEIYESLGNRTEAVRHYKAALSTFRRLRDRIMIAQITRRLTELNALN